MRSEGEVQQELMVLESVVILRRWPSVVARSGRVQS